MKFIVDRKKWYRGHGSDDSALLREDGTRCCIGFVGQQCGVPNSLMMNRSCIRDGRHSLQGFPKWMYQLVTPISYNTLTDAAYRANDNMTCSDEVREAELKNIFSAQGDEIEFVG